MKSAWADIERFKEQKNHDLKEALISYAVMQISMCKKGIQVWTNAKECFSKMWLSGNEFLLQVPENGSTVYNTNVILLHDLHTNHEINVIVNKGWKGHVVKCLGLTATSVARFICGSKECKGKRVTENYSSVLGQRYWESYPRKYELNCSETCETPCSVMCRSLPDALLSNPCCLEFLMLKGALVL